MLDFTKKPLAVSPLPMASALAAADRVSGGTPVWHPDTHLTEARLAAQLRWLERFRPRAEVAAKIAEIQSNATRDFEAHVAWLKARGWDTMIEPQGEVLFLASVLDVFCKWLVPGKGYSEQIGEQAIRRVVLADGVAVKRRPGSSDAPIVRIEAIGGDQVWVQQVETDFGGSEEALLAYVQEHFLAAPDHGDDATELDFPMVRLAHRRKADFMIGLHAGSTEVSQAFEQMTFEMGKRGAHARAMAEIGALECYIPPPPRIKLTDAFVSAVIRPDVKEPLLATFCPPSVWNAPAGEEDDQPGEVDEG